MRTSSGPSRLFVLALFSAASACALVLDLPDPSLDPGFSPDTDASTSTDATVGVETGSVDLDGATVDADVVTTCDLSLPQHCGACNVDCTGGTCSNGICLLAETYESGALKSPSGLTIVGQEVFVTISEGAIARCSTGGCATGGLTSLVRFDGGETPRAITSDDAGTLFWTSYNNGTPAGGAYRTELDASTLFLNAGSPRSFAGSIAVHDALVAWTADDDPGGSFICPKTGCSNPLQPLIGSGGNDAGRYGKAAAPSSLGFLFADNAKIWLCPTADCSTKRLIATGYNALATDGRYAYFRSFQGDLMSATLDTATPQVTLLVPTTKFPTDFRSPLVVGTSLYWVLKGTEPDDGGLTNDGAIQKCVIPACTTVIDVATNQAAPTGLASDGKAIYWSNGGVTDNNGFRGAVYKAPL